MGATFADVTAVTLTSPGRFTAEVDAEWTIAGKPNGGYLLAIVGRAAATQTPHPHVIATSAHYLRSPDPGPVAIEATVLRSGRTVSQLRLQLHQDEHLCLEALVTMSSLAADSVPYWDAGLHRPEFAARADCLRVPGISPIGLPVPIMDQIDLRIDPATASFARGEPSGQGELRAWLELPAGEPFDPTALLYAVDALPPATFNIAPTGWVPTLELTAYVRALPAPGAVMVQQKAQLIDDQKVDEVCFVWDSTGRLVAQATQLAGIRLG